MKILSKLKYGYNNSIYMIYIDCLNYELIKTLDRRIVEICEGFTSSGVDLVKIRIKKFLSKKTEEQKIGSIAEFMVHLFIKEELKLKQEFRFFNLEEDSLKKGLDGLYSKDNDTWIMESKSGKISTACICHEAKVKEAYINLKNKVEGRGINPWSNAYSHASNFDINPNQNIREIIKKLDDNFILGEYKKIKDFNIIPAGTIYLENKENEFVCENIFSDIINFIDNNDISNSTILCISQKTKNIFLDYLNL